MAVHARDDGLVAPVKIGAFVMVAVLAFALALMFDRPVFRIVHNPAGMDAWLYSAVRQLGEMLTWIIALPIVILVDRLIPSQRTGLQSFERGMTVFWAPALAGFAGSMLKLLLRRERPDANDGAYAYRPWDVDTWDSSGLGLPSGHASVAFGAAFILSFLFPRLTPLWMLGGAMCAFSRLLTQAHFLSDVVGGAIVGGASAWIVWVLYRVLCENRTPVSLRIMRALTRRSSVPLAK